MEGFELKPLIAAPFTPLDQDGEPNYPVIKEYADYLVACNFTGIFVNGTLAEGLSMTIEERKQLAQAWMDASSGRLQTIIHVGTNCIKEAQELSRHAEEIGADAIAAYTPSYYKPENEDVLADVMALVAGVAPKTPFYYYDINFCTGLYINVRSFMEKAKKKIPTLVGLKHSSREMPSAHSCTFIEGVQVLVGSDNQYLSCLSLGMPGVVVGSYLGNLFYDMRRAFDAGDMKRALELQNVAQHINDIRSKHGGGINVAKALFTILTGIDVGPVRLPLRQLTSDEIASLFEDFMSASFKDIARPRK